MGRGAILVGIIFILFGAWLSYNIFSSSNDLFSLIFPIGLIILGIVLIIMHNAEDKIEQRKDLK